MGNLAEMSVEKNSAPCRLYYNNQSPIIHKHQLVKSTARSLTPDLFIRSGAPPPPSD